MKTILLLVTLLLSFTIFAQETRPAGDEGSGFNRGNGGNIIVCNYGEEKTYEVLDLFEGKHVWHFRLDRDLVQDNLNYKQIIHLVLNKVMMIGMRDGLRLKSYYERMKSNSELLPNHVFIKTYDQGNVFVPSYCELEQGAIQWIVPPIGMKEFIFNKYYWEKISELHKAALVMHEVLYKTYITESVIFGRPVSKITSYDIRYYVAYLFSDQFGQLGGVN